jgi:hypothetical protein
MDCDVMLAAQQTQHHHTTKLGPPPQLHAHPPAANASLYVTGGSFACVFALDFSFLENNII